MKVLFHKLINNIRRVVHKDELFQAAWGKDNRSTVILLLFVLGFSCIFTRAIRINAADNAKIQEGIAGEIIRFHVIANSDGKMDQELKYKVKDALLKELSPLLNEVGDISEGRKILISMLPLIEETANSVILQNGFQYPVKTSLETCYFPMKVYGDYTFPPGKYEALRVTIGKGEGKNWWCVMFPPLCFVDETYSIVDEDTQEQIKYLLTEEEYEALRAKKVPVKVKFKILDAIKDLFS